MAKSLPVINLDASDKSLGRVASEVAITLRGKKLVTFKPNVNPQQKVVVTNLAKAKFTGNKLDTKRYYRYSGYPSGLKTTSLREQFTKNPEALFKKMVRLMLPKNRLAAQILRNLTVYQNEK
ncbi:MAG: 50S ribosomal protein L13 [Patescibacteria group bacterium]